MNNLSLGYLYGKWDQYPSSVWRNIQLNNAYEGFSTAPVLK